MNLSDSWSTKTELCDIASMVLVGVNITRYNYYFSSKLKDTFILVNIFLGKLIFFVPLLIETVKNWNLCFQIRRLLTRFMWHLTSLVLNSTINTFDNYSLIDNRYKCNQTRNAWWVKDKVPILSVKNKCPRPLKLPFQNTKKIHKMDETEP